VPRRGETTDLAGMVFGRLTAREFVGVNTHRDAVWRCHCSCGREVLVVGANLQSGNSASCGCVRQHGHSGTLTHTSWSSMLARCRNKRHGSYADYGGRGIKVCARWHSFPNFLEDMGERPSRAYSLDRIDVNGNYEPGNCRWATDKVQQSNRRCNVRITSNSRTQTVSEWADELGMARALLRWRLAAGWPVEKALYYPVEPRRPR